MLNIILFDVRKYLQGHLIQYIYTNNPCYTIYTDRLLGTLTQYYNAIILRIYLFWFWCKVVRKFFSTKIKTNAVFRVFKVIALSLFQDILVLQNLSHDVHNTAHVVQAPNPDDDVEEVTIVAGGVEKGKEPSRCVWAILSCCAPSNTPIRYTCFDVLGCSTAFWDTNPCVPAIIKTALDQATQFYGPTTSTNRTETPTTTTTAPPPAAAPVSAGSDNVAVDLRDFMASTTAATDTTVAETTQSEQASPLQSASVTVRILFSRVVKLKNIRFSPTKIITCYNNDE